MPAKAHNLYTLTLVNLLRIGLVNSWWRQAVSSSLHNPRRSTKIEQTTKSSVVAPKSKHPPKPLQPQRTKVFCFFFTKKKSLLSLA
jgi:hypothetical protein